MAKPRQQASAPAERDRLEDIKKLVVIAMFSDDELMQHLVLKGGNLLDLVQKISTRASADVDFSMEQDFPEGQEAFRNRIERALQTTFREEGYAVFDVKMAEKPEQITEDVRGFWGGYGIEFKIIENAKYEELSGDIDALRRNAIRLGQGQKFLIDISRFEYVANKERRDFEGYVIFVYSASMMVCEKLRAICQQMLEYGPVIKRKRPGTPRARDFVDLHALVSTLKVDVSSNDTQFLLKHIFAAKRVPLSLLGLISGHREFHRADFPAVEATVKAGVKLEPFDFYFDYVLGLVQELESFWNV